MGGQACKSRRAGPKEVCDNRHQEGEGRCGSHPPGVTDNVCWSLPQKMDGEESSPSPPPLPPGGKQHVLFMRFLGASAAFRWAPLTG